MSRITGGEVAKLIDAYNSVYTPQESQEEISQEVQENIEQITEQPYTAWDPLGLFTKSGIERNKRLELQKQRLQQQKPATSKVRVGVTDPKTDIGKRTGEAIGGFLGGLKSKAQQFGAEAERQVQRVGGYNTPAAKPPAAKPPAATPPAATPPAAAKPTPTPTPAAARPAARPAGSPMDQWRANFPKLAAKVTPSGTQRGTGQSVVAKQSAELRSMQQASQARQAAQSGPMYSSPDVKSKMSTKSKTLLGVKEQYDAYDLVLEYLFSQGHVETLEEALYVMMEMPTETIQGIVEGIMPEPINPDAHKEVQRLARQQGKVRALEAGAATPGEKQAAQGKLKGPQLPRV